MKHSLHRIFFFLTLALLPVQLGYHFWPEWATVLGRRVDYLSPIIYVTDIFLWVTLISWAISERKKWKPLTFPSFFYAGIFVMLVNIFFSKNIPVSLYQWAKVIEFLLFGLYIVRTKPAFKYCVRAFSVAVLYSSILAIIQFVLQRAVGGPMWLFGERIFFSDTPGIAQTNLCDITGQSCALFLRPYATFPHPNVLGGFLALMLPYLLYGILQKKIQKSKVLLAVFVAGFFALILTFSRSAWVVGVLGMLFVIHVSLKTNKNQWYMRYGNVILTGILFFSVLSGYALFQNAAGTESIIVRRELNVAAIRMISDNPLTGVGWGNFLTAIPSYMTTRTIYFLQPVHNMYLLAFSQLGVIGIIYICICMVIFRKYMKKRNPITTASLVAIFLLGFVDHYFITLQQGQLMITVVVALFIATPNKIKENTPTS